MGAAVSEPAADSHLTSLKLDSGDPVKKRFGVALPTKSDLWQSKTIFGVECQSIHNQYQISVVKYMHIPVNRIPGTWSIFMCQAGESLVSTRYDQVTWSIPGVDYSLCHPVCIA